MQPHLVIAALGALGTVLAQAPVTVPAAYASVDAPSRLWVAGVTVDLRQQTIIDASHLAPLAGRDLVAISFRRDVDGAAFSGGTAHLLVRIGHAAMEPLSASAEFASNLPQPLTVFDGTITIPNSPAGASADWTPERTIRVPFAVPFRYQGGPLTIDLTGTADSQSPVLWWPADAAWDHAAGTVASVGVGCGLHANAQGEWAGSAATRLVVGGTAQLSARGTEHGLALLFLSLSATAPGMPLENLLPGAMPGCSVYIAMPTSMVVTSFAQVPFPGQGGTALHFLRIPNQSWALGAGFASQWMDLQQQFATSNATLCTIAPMPPSLGMVVVRGSPGEASGIVIVNQAHVMRFEWQ